MKLVNCFLFFTLMQFSIASAADLVSLRKMYYEASVKKEHADKFLSVMTNLKVESDPLLLCYRGMANLIQANHSFNPYNKLDYFSKGKQMLEKAIAMDAQNIEIRFMRFCVQTNAPFFLGYSSNVAADKEVILKGWSKITDLDLKGKIKNYMIKSDACSSTEKLILQ